MADQNISFTAYRSFHTISEDGVSLDLRRDEDRRRETQLVFPSGDVIRYSYLDEAEAFLDRNSFLVASIRSFNLEGITKLKLDSPDGG
jgi:hypothetical protein